MVASECVDASPVGKSRQCTGVEAYFARLIACEGMLPSRAYRVAWKTDATRARDLAPRVMARPWVAAKIAELRAAADREAVMDMVRRRRMLADIAEAGWRRRKGSAKPADAIAAIREDAILAGERRTDGTQVNVAGDVSFTVVLQALRAPGSSAQAQPVIDVPAQMPALAAPVDSGEVSAETHTLVAPERETRAEAPTCTPCGPLGRIVGLSGAGPTDEPSGRETRAASPEAGALGFDD